MSVYTFTLEGGADLLSPADEALTAAELHSIAVRTVVETSKLCDSFLCFFFSLSRFSHRSPG